MKKPFNYSPLPAERYRLAGAEGDEVGVLLSLPEHAQAAWNLFWLSHPGIDILPGAGLNWRRVYQPIIGLAAAVITDVVEDPVLSSKVVMHPDAFIEWFEREDHTIYDLYDRFGDTWVQAVLRRADEVSLRLIAANPLVSVRGNVLQVDFSRVDGQRAA